MKAEISAKLLKLAAAKPGERAFEIWDTRLQGFVLRVQPSGARAYYAQYGRHKRIALGKVGHIKPDEARSRCTRVLGNVASNLPPLHGLDSDRGETLGDFVRDTYAPWAHATHPRTAAGTLDRLELHFVGWYTWPLKDITAEAIEKWRVKRINGGKSPATVRRDLDTLASVLTRAVRMKRVTENVARQVERPKIDAKPHVRFLTPAEEQRLRAALAKRDSEMRAARKSANEWRRERAQDPLPALPHFGDHLTPAVLLSINTGVRRGELLALRWSAVDFKAKRLTVAGATAKTQQTRHIDLNAGALAVLKRWKAQAPDDARVFPIATGLKTAWAALLTRAKITNCRWHDLRHHFASRLVQAGAPLNTVRELLGHGSMAMTLRYAHLSPDQKADAVALLDAPRTAL